MPIEAGCRFTIITKPTTRCNLSCDYCYAEPDEEQMTMNEKTLQNFLFQTPSLIRQNEKIEILWHGGEPLLMGIDFFKKAVKIESEIEEDYNIGFDNTMQSNLTLLDSNTAKFLKENGFHVGTSIDGPEYLHNIARKYPNGKGSFEDVMKGVMNLRKEGERIGAICVLNRTNKDNIKEIYQFFKSIKMGFKLNPLINSDRVKDKTGVLGITSEDYFNSLIELFQIWYFDANSSISVDTLSKEIMEPILTGHSCPCSYSEHSCQEDFFSIDPDGNIYPCGRFGEKAEFLYGNVNRTDLKEIMKSGKRKMFLDRFKKLDDCRSCPEVKLCNGGCPHNAYMEYGTINRKDPYCSSRKESIRYIREVIKRELEKAKAVD